MPTKDANGIVLPDMGELTPDYRNPPVTEYRERSMLASPGKVRLVPIDCFAVVNKSGDPYHPVYGVARINKQEFTTESNIISKHVEEDEVYDEFYKLNDIKKILDE